MAPTQRNLSAVSEYLREQFVIPVETMKKITDHFASELKKGGFN